jgi:hypothetical protein
MVCGRCNEQNGASLAVIVQAPPSGKDAFAVLPSNLPAAVEAL